MVLDAISLGFAFITTGAILFLLVYIVLSLSDLESDYLNARECCGKLNFWVFPQFGVHFIACFLLLFSWHWVLFLFNAPMVSWLGFELFRQPSGSLGVYDPAEIHNRGTIKRHLKNCMIRIGYYLTMFFVYLYCIISALLRGDPIRRHEDGEIVSQVEDIGL